MKDPISNHPSKILYRIKLLDKSKGHTGRISLISDIDLSYNVIILTGFEPGFDYQGSICPLTL